MEAGRPKPLAGSVHDSPTPQGDTPLMPLSVFVRLIGEDRISEGCFGLFVFREFVESGAVVPALRSAKLAPREDAGFGKHLLGIAVRLPDHEKAAGGNRVDL